MQVLWEAVALVRVSSKFHAEVGVVDQVLEEVNVAPPEMSDVVSLQRQKAKVGGKAAVVDLAQLVVGEVQVLDVVEVGQVAVCGDLLDLVPW